VLSSKLTYALLSDPGRVRSQNEDAGAAFPEAGAYVVCDGMGGAAGGEIASRLAIDSFLDHLEAGLPRSDPGDASTPTRAPAGHARPQTRIHAAVHAANEAVYRRSLSNPELTGMGTTLVALLYVAPPQKDRRSVPRSPRPRFVPPPSLFLAHVGDSRCYRRRNGELLQLTTDHSFVEEQVRAGQITSEQAAHSPLRNYITRAIGPHAHIEPDIQAYRPLAGDLYLLASDGLSGELSNAEIAAVLGRTVATSAPTQPELEAACAALIRSANERGGHDNITVLLLAFC
jgi:protein phosphatase